MRKRSSTKRPEPEPTFFADRNLGKEFVRILREANWNIEAHDEHFPHNTEDVTWIERVTDNAWIILTADKKISRDQREIDALMSGGGRAYLPKGRMIPSEFARLLDRSRTRVYRHIRKQKKYRRGPYMAKIGLDDRDITKMGHVETWIDKKVWRSKVTRRK